MGLCKHKKYRIISCNKQDKKYVCQCERCKKEFDMPKAEGEMYVIGTILNK